MKFSVIDEKNENTSLMFAKQCQDNETHVLTWLLCSSFSQGYVQWIVNDSRASEPKDQDEDRMATLIFMRVIYVLGWGFV